MKHYIGPVLVILGCVILFGFNLGDLSFLKGDENYYFSSARRMMREGDWITPWYHHHIRFEKPVLYYWLVALFLKLFGVSWWSARLTSVIFGALTVLLTYLLALRFFAKKTAYLSAAILATTFLFFSYARLAVIDMTFLFFITLSLFLFIKGERENTKLFLLSFASLGFATLAKGPLGLVVVGLIVLAYIIKTKRYRILKDGKILLGILILLCIALPWPLLMYKIHGQEYISHIWEVEAVDKAVGSMTRLENVDNIIWFAVRYVGYYIPVVIFSFMPWSLFLPFGLKRLKTEKDEDRAFIICWFLCVFIFFTAASFKHTHYMLLLAPPLAMIVASFLAAKTERLFYRAAPIAITAVTFTVYMALVGALLPAINDGTLRIFALKLASEIREQDEEIGITSRGFNLKKVGIHLNNLISTPHELSGDDLAQYRLVNREYLAPFVTKDKRVFCLITKEDYITYVPQVVRDRLYLLEKNLMWKRFKLKTYLPLALKGDWKNLKEEAYLISNRR